MPPPDRVNWALTAGDVLSHYRVLFPLGSGGMSQVYLAEDVRLGRRLALKVLPPRGLRDEERMLRFEREARAISALNHPNILTVYDVGHQGDVQFLATEYIDGITLRTALARGPLDVRSALNLAVQIAEAVNAAHEASIIHRDLKPENVMIRPDGYVKVLDFGLAKLTGESFGGEAASTRLVETQDGVLMGTFNYMAPEQARGADLDHRADLFALGVLIYEMLAGHAPFLGASAADIVGAILFREPKPLVPSPTIPVELDRIVRTALRKERERRYQTCALLLQDLRLLAHAIDAGGVVVVPAGEWSRPSTASIVPSDSSADTVASSPFVEPAPKKLRRGRRIESLAVLPLANSSGDAELEYFTDGLTESLINNLSQVPRLRVMARSTVFRYKSANVDPRTVGQQLGVQAVLAGHVVQRAGELFVSAELIDVSDGSQLWGTMMNRRVADGFALQAEISAELAGALRLRLSRDERKKLGKRHTVNADAYQRYLRGRYFLNSRSGDALKQARSQFESAIGVDPGYALAHAGLADCCSLLAVGLRSSSGGTLVEQGRAAAQRALQLDEGLAEAHASLAFIKFRFDWDWPGAEAEFTRALAVNPGHAPSRQWHAMFLAARARFDEALAEIQRALELDPLSLTIQAGVGRILHFAGRYAEAVRQYDNVLLASPGFGQAHIDLAMSRMALGELASARASLGRARELLGDVSTIGLLEGCCAVREGRLDEARAAFDALRQAYDRGAAGPDDLAMLAAAMGESETAVEWLTRACAQRSPFLGYVDVEPAMAPLRRDPACRRLLRQHGFRADG